MKRPFLAVLCLCVLTLSVYSFSIQGAYKTLDDEASIVRNENIRDFRNLGTVLKTSYFGGNFYYRPLVYISYMVEYHFFGLNPFYYYLTNILIHIASSLVLLVLMNFLFRSRGLAYAIALAFALHPIHWEAVSNIPGRSILLCAFFYFTAFLLFCLAHQEGKYHRWYDRLSGVSFVFALLSKESAAMLPLILVCYQWIVNRKPGDSLWKKAASTIPYFLVLPFYILLRKNLGITHLFQWRTWNQSLLEIITFLNSVISHLRSLVFPLGLHFDRSEKMLTSFIQPEVIVTVLFYALSGVLLFRVRHRMSPLAKFFCVWFWVELIPVSQIITSIAVQPGFISAAEHFLYTPSVGVLVILALLIRDALRKGMALGIFSIVTQRVIVAGIYGFLMLMTIQHNIYSSNEVAMLERALELNPHNVRVRLSLGLLYARLNRFVLAEEQFRRVLEVNPFNVRARISLGKALCDQGKYWEGIAEYDNVYKPAEMEELLLGNRNAAYSWLEQMYQSEIEKRPDDAQAHYSLGVVYSKTGRTQEAVSLYTQALALNPENKHALFNLSSTYASLKEWNNAVQHFETMIHLAGPKDQLDDLAYGQLSWIYEKLGDPEKAEKYKLMAQPEKENE